MSDARDNATTKPFTAEHAHTIALNSSDLDLKLAKCMRKVESSIERAAKHGLLCVTLDARELYHTYGQDALSTMQDIIKSRGFKVSLFYPELEIRW